MPVTVITLHGQGRKCWVVFPGEVAIKSEKTAKCPKSKIAQVPKLSLKAMYVNQCLGDTLYLRYGWHNAVLTSSPAEQWTFLLSIRNENDENRVQNDWKWSVRVQPFSNRFSGFVRIRNGEEDGFHNRR